MDVIAQANETTASNPWIPSARWERLTNIGTLAGLVAALSGVVIAFFPWPLGRSLGSLLVAGGVLTMLILPGAYQMRAQQLEDRRIAFRRGRGWPPRAIRDAWGRAVPVSIATEALAKTGADDPTTRSPISSTNGDSR